MRWRPEGGGFYKCETDTSLSIKKAGRNFTLSNYRAGACASTRRCPRPRRPPAGLCWPVFVHRKWREDPDASRLLREAIVAADEAAFALFLDRLEEAGEGGPAADEGRALLGGRWARLPWRDWYWQQARYHELVPCLASTVREARKALGLSHKALVDRAAGCLSREGAGDGPRPFDERQLREWESGAAGPAPEHLRALEGALGVALAHFAWPADD